MRVEPSIKPTKPTLFIMVRKLQLNPPVFPQKECLINSLFKISKKQPIKSLTTP